MRILVTGSRDWTDWRTLTKALVEHWDYSVTLVHGDCPTGADEMADWLCSNVLNQMECILTVERHPANWSRGRRAGPERNAHMISLGADLCLAFIGACTSPRCDIGGKHPSHGASGTADLAEKAGIPVRRFLA